NLPFSLTPVERKRENVVLDANCPSESVKRLSRKSISLALVVCLLAPTLAVAQPAPGAPPPGVPQTPPTPQTPRTPGAFAPLAPGRGDLYLGQQARSIAGPDYRLGPGDVLDVQIVGRLDVTRVQIVVDPEGAIALPPLGTIRVARLTLLEANRTITARARAIFRYADVSIAVISPRSFEVVVSGEVERPGTLEVLATQRLHEVILTTGGLTPRGRAPHACRRRRTQGNDVARPAHRERRRRRSAAGRRHALRAAPHEHPGRGRGARRLQRLRRERQDADAGQADDRPALRAGPWRAGA